MIPRDDKDWTWVLTRPCPECGFDAVAVERERIADMIRENAAAWARVLTDPLARSRPSDDVWSALEYACHVRDVFTIYDGRLARMLAEDDPLYPNWDQNATAIDDSYVEQRPHDVAEQVRAAAMGLATRFEKVSGAQWDRTGRRSDGAQFTIDSFARYMVHDPVHHLHDVANGMRLLQQGR